MERHTRRLVLRAGLGPSRPCLCARRNGHLRSRAAQRSRLRLAAWPGRPALGGRGYGATAEANRVRVLRTPRGKLGGRRVASTAVCLRTEAAVAAIHGYGSCRGWFGRTAGLECPRRAQRSNRCVRGAGYAAATARRGFAPYTTPAAPRLQHGPVGLYGPRRSRGGPSSARSQAEGRLVPRTSAPAGLTRTSRAEPLSGPWQRAWTPSCPDARIAAINPLSGAAVRAVRGWSCGLCC